MILVLIKSFNDLYSERSKGAEKASESDVHDSSAEASSLNIEYELPPSPIDKRRDGFIVRLLLMEHFTVHSIGMSRQDYSFVTFKEVEKVVLET